MNDVTIKRVEQNETEILITISVAKNAAAGRPEPAAAPPSDHAVTNTSASETEATTKAIDLLKAEGMVADVEDGALDVGSPSPGHASPGEGPYSLRDELAELTPKQRVAVAQQARDQAGVLNVNGELTGDEYTRVLAIIQGVR